MSSIREFTSVSVVNNSNIVQINTTESNFSVVPGSMIVIAGDRPRVVISGDTASRTLTLNADYVGPDLTSSATLLPLSAMEHLLNALTALTDAQQSFNENVEQIGEGVITRENLASEIEALGITGASTSDVEVIADAGATQSISKTVNAVVDMTLTNATTNIECTRRTDDKAHTVTLILRQGSGANEVNWTNVAWPEGSAPLLTFEAGKFDVIDLLVTKDNVVGMYKGGWYA